MNRIFSLFAAAPMLLVVACSGSPDAAGGSDSTEADLTTKICGGIAGLTCPSGYACEMATPHHPDQTGACKKAPKQHICGGIAGLACPTGFACEMSGPSHPDQSGTCTKDATGQMCGGFAGIACPSGFACEMSGPVHPDQSGSCARK